MPFARILVVAVLAAALSGCLTRDRAKPAPISLPPLPVNIASACRDPGVNAGQPVLVEFAKNRAAFAKCRRGGLVNEKFYNDLRGK